MKQYCETRKCDDGFTYEIYRRSTYDARTLYYPVDRFTKDELIGGCVFECPEQLHEVEIL